MSPREHSTKSDVVSFSRARTLRLHGEAELWINAWESALLKPHGRLTSKIRNTLLRA